MNAPPQPMKRWPQFLVLVILFAYCATFLVIPPEWIPSAIQHPIRDARRFVIRAIHQVATTIAGNGFPSELTNGAYLLLIAGLFPMIAARLFGRSLYDLGWRSPNRLALRYFLVGVVISVPFLIWMVNSSTIATPYLKQLDRLGFSAFAAFYLVNMFTEHLLLHGVVLGLARPDGCWPQSVPLVLQRKGFTGFLRWLGLANPSNHAVAHRCVSWLGLASGCLIPIGFSALLFGLVHLGKDTRELILAFPGGLAQAYITYRSNSWFTPFLIHLATASLALAMMLGMR